MFLFAAPQVNKNDIETPLKFVSVNPSYVLASTLKNTPLYLNCHVSVEISKQLEEDLKIKPFYSVDEGEDEDDEDDDEDYGVRDDEVVKNFYNKQYESNLYKINQTKAFPMVKPRTKRDVVVSGLSFEWLRDKKTVISLNFTADKSANADGYTLFTNGTLKFQATNSTAGLYKCKVKYTKQGKTKIEIGPMISTSTFVDVASEFKKELFESFLNFFSRLQDLLTLFHDYKSFY